MTSVVLDQTAPVAKTAPALRFPTRNKLLELIKQASVAAIAECDRKIQEADVALKGAAFATDTDERIGERQEYVVSKEAATQSRAVQFAFVEWFDRLSDTPKGEVRGGSFVFLDSPFGLECALLTPIDPLLNLDRVQLGSRSAEFVVITAGTGVLDKTPTLYAALEGQVEGATVQDGSGEDLRILAIR